MQFLKDKRWEVLLGVLLTLVVPFANGMLDAINSGQFRIDNPFVNLVAVFGLGLITRAFASYKQAPPATEMSIEDLMAQLDRIIKHRDNLDSLVTAFARRAAEQPAPKLATTSDAPAVMAPAQ